MKTKNVALIAAAMAMTLSATVLFGSCGSASSTGCSASLPCSVSTNVN